MALVQIIGSSPYHLLLGAGDMQLLSPLLYSTSSVLCRSNLAEEHHHFVFKGQKKVHMDGSVCVMSQRRPSNTHSLCTSQVRAGFRALLGISSEQVCQNRPRFTKGIASCWPCNSYNVPKLQYRWQVTREATHPAAILAFLYPGACCKEWFKNWVWCPHKTGSLFLLLILLHMPRNWFSPSANLSWGHTGPSFLKKWQSRLQWLARHRCFTQVGKAYRTSLSGWGLWKPCYNNQRWNAHW